VEKGEWKGPKRKPLRCRLRICSSGFQNKPKKTQQEGEIKNNEKFLRRKDFFPSHIDERARGKRRGGSKKTSCEGWG